MRLVASEHERAALAADGRGRERLARARLQHLAEPPQVKPDLNRRAREALALLRREHARRHEIPGHDKLAHARTLAQIVRPPLQALTLRRLRRRIEEGHARALRLQGEHDRAHPGARDTARLVHEPHVCPGERQPSLVQARKCRGEVDFAADARSQLPAQIDAGGHDCRRPAALFGALDKLRLTGCLAPARGQRIDDRGALAGEGQALPRGFDPRAAGRLVVAKDGHSSPAAPRSESTSAARARRIARQSLTLAPRSTAGRPAWGATPCDRLRSSA